MLAMTKRLATKGSLQRRSQSGATMVEFAVASAVFFMLLLGLVLWGMTLWQANTLQYAVERGARCAIISGCGAQPDAFAASQALGLATAGIGGGAEKYVVQSSGNSDVGTANFYTACVRTVDRTETNPPTNKSAVDSIAGAVPLIRSLAKLSSVRYCRPVQG